MCGSTVFKLSHNNGLDQCCSVETLESIPREDEEYEPKGTRLVPGNGHSKCMVVLSGFYVGRDELKSQRFKLSGECPLFLTQHHY